MNGINRSEAYSYIYLYTTSDKRPARGLRGSDLVHETWHDYSLERGDSRVYSVSTLISLV